MALWIRTWVGRSRCHTEAHEALRAGRRDLRIHSANGFLDTQPTLRSHEQSMHGENLATPQTRAFRPRVRSPVHRPEAEALLPRVPSAAPANAPCLPRGAAQAQVSQAESTQARPLPLLPAAIRVRAHTRIPTRGPRPAPPPCPSAAAPWHRTALAPWWGQARSTGLSPLSGI